MDKKNKAMTKEEATTILTEMQKWRRAEPPYDGVTPLTRRDMPYRPHQFGEAIDVAIHHLQEPVSTELINRIITLHTEYRYGSMLRTESEEEYITRHLAQP